MSKSNDFETAGLKLVYQNQVDAIFQEISQTSPNGILASVVDGNIWWGLHSAVPGEGDTQDASELAYQGYSRAAAPRTTSGHTVSGNTVSNGIVLAFGALVSGGPVTARGISTGVAASGASEIIHKGPLAVAASQPFTAESVNNTVTAPSHGLVSGDQLVLITAEGATLPTPLAAGTYYFALRQDDDTFEIEATLGGGTINLTADGSGRFAEVLPITITTNQEPKLDIGTATITED